MTIEMMATITEALAFMRMHDLGTTYEEIVEEACGVFNAITPEMHSEHMDMWHQEFNEALSRGLNR